MSSGDANRLHVLQHHERRVASGETQRKFYVREEHMDTLRRFMIANGLPNQHVALQAMMDRFRDIETPVRNSQPAARNANPTTKDSA